MKNQAIKKLISKFNNWLMHHSQDSKKFRKKVLSKSTRRVLKKADALSE